MLGELRPKPQVFWRFRLLLLGEGRGANSFGNVSNQEAIGIVTFFHVRRGFGRIRTDRHPEGVFSHFSAVQEPAQILIPNELVWLDVTQGSKGPVAKNIRRVTGRLQGTIHRHHGACRLIRTSGGSEYVFSPKDILSDNRSFNRILAGWQVQFSPFEDEHELTAKEIVICDTRPPFLQMVKANAWEKRLQGLSRLAEDERWEDPEANRLLPVLENYLYETFRILWREGGIHIIDRYAGEPEVAIWNTGLLSKNGEDILARMDEIQNPEPGQGYLTPARWRLSGFFPQSDRRIPPLSHRLPLAMAFVPHNKLVPDPSAWLVPDLDHLLKRHQRLPGYWSALPREEQIQRLQGALHKLSQLLRRNPRMAIPQWYEETVQYLVPLDIGDGKGPIGALVLEEQDHQLRVQTILQLNWAYQNARLLGPQQDNWLARWKARQVPNPDPKVY